MSDAFLDAQLRSARSAVTGQLSLVSAYMTYWEEAALARIAARRKLDDLQWTNSQGETEARIAAVLAQQKEAAARVTYYDAVTKRKNLQRIADQAAIMAAEKSGK